MRWLALVLVLQAIPGLEAAVDELGEALTNTVAEHNATHGEGNHDGESPEHCCTGLFHTCGCHVQAQGAPPQYVAAVSIGFSALTVNVADRTAVRSREERESPFRPPAV